MAYDEGQAQLLRDDIGERPGLAEKRMFGGLAYMLDGHMLCGVHKDGAMYRVGKPNYAAALALPDVGEMAFTGRPMSGFVSVGEDALADDATRGALLDMALGFVATLPPKS